MVLGRILKLGMGCCLDVTSTLDSRPNEDHLVGYEEDVTLEEREWMRSE